ncbi:hypothetical protein T06_2488 [Trichinella sp. T6]|nr:hypothetical protein T06_2488 [Trichinella sp. T6]
MLRTHKYHINTAITETCIKQPFTILYMLEFICMLKASKIDMLTLSLMRKAPFIDSVKLTVARYLRSMTTQDRDVVETKQSYSCIHFHRKMHGYLKHYGQIVTLK